MKKKSTILGGLLLAVAVTSYSVAGTYAKYTSSIDLTDEARVAKWDFFAVNSNDCKVVETEEGTRYTCSRAENLDLFASSYTYNNDTKLYVKSLDGDKVVAPGTKGEYQVNFGGAMEVRHDFKAEFGVVDGKEVAVSYNINADGSLTIYDDATTGSKVYSPITYTLNLFNGNQTLAYEEGSLADIQKALSDWNNSSANDFAPGRLGVSFRISWKWDTVNNVAGLSEAQVNELDTYIGKNWNKWYPDSTGENDLGDKSIYKLTASATQIAEDHSTKANN